MDEDKVVGASTGLPLVDVAPEFQEPFVVDSSKIQTKLDVHATPVEQAIAETLASYRTTATNPASRGI